MSSGGQQRRRPTAEVDGLERRARAGSDRTVRRVEASARSSSSTCEGVDELPDPGPRPARRAPAMTTKSQYGQSETQNGTWT